MARRRSSGCGCLIVLLIAVGIITAFLGDRGYIRDVPEKPKVTDPAEMLGNGDGDDWVAMSDRDKMALCRKAAETLGHGDDVAWAYRGFLEEFYRTPNPDTRRRRIFETLAVCQALIDMGEIAVNSEKSYGEAAEAYRWFKDAVESKAAERASPAFRTWTDNTGKFKVEAEFVSYAIGTVKLRKSDGEVITLPMDRLSEADQEWIRERGRSRP